MATADTDCDAHSVPAPSAGLVLLLCANAALVDLAGPVVFPALAAIMTEFAVSPAKAQLVVTAHLAGSAIMQPFLGPVADAVGRSRVLIGSLLALGLFYVLAGLAQSFEWLVAARAAQGLFGSAGIVLGRAIARDRSPDASSCTRLVGYIVVTAGVCSLLGPPVAGWLIASVSWRAPMLGLGFASVGVACTTAWWLLRHPSGTSATGLQDATRAPLTMKRIGRLLRHPRFLGNTLALGASMAAMFTLVGMIPLWFAVQRGTSSVEVGLWMSAVSAFFIVGAAVASRTAVPARTALAWASLTIVAGYALVGGLRIGLDPTSSWAIIPGTALVSFAAGYFNPITLAQALDADTAMTGTAAGLSSSLSLAMLAGGAQLSATLLDASPFALLAYGLACAGLCWAGTRWSESGGAPLSPGTEAR